jgi:hypothetical protein
MTGAPPTGLPGLRRFLRIWELENRDFGSELSGFGEGFDQKLGGLADLRSGSTILPLILVCPASRGALRLEE